MEDNLKPHKIEQIMKSAMLQLKSMIDVNTVIGSPMKLDDNTVIIPITKVIVGLVAGGGEYNENTLSKQKSPEYPFAAGSGSGFQIIPVGFLIKEKADYKMIDIETSVNSVTLMELIAKVLNNFSGKEKKVEEVDDEK